MSALEIGDVVTRDVDGVSYRLVAADGRAWVAERIDGVYEGLTRLTPRTLSAYHRGDDPIDDAATPRRGSEQAGKDAMAAVLLDEARKQEPGWWALSDAWRAKEAQAAAARAEEEAAQRAEAALDDFHAFVGDEL